MQLDLTRIRKADDSFDRTFPPDELAQGDDPYRIVAPVHLAFAIHKDKDRFRLTGRVDSELELTCSRCLEPYRLAIGEPFDQRYLPLSETIATEDEVEVEDDDLGTGYYKDDQIDLGGLVREQFFLILPMKPLCAESCKGLCVQCGTNLNTGSCECKTMWEDPRFAELKRLK